MRYVGTMAEYLERRERALDYMAQWRLEMGRNGMTHWWGDYIGWLRTAMEAAKSNCRVPSRDRTPMPLT